MVLLVRLLCVDCAVAYWFTGVWVVLRIIVLCLNWWCCLFLLVIVYGWCFAVLALIGCVWSLLWCELVCG